MSSLQDILDKTAAYEVSLPPFPRVSFPGALPLASFLDSAIHRPEATPADIDRVCDDAIASHFATVFTNPVHLQRVVNRLQGSGVNAGLSPASPSAATPPP